MPNTVTFTLSRTEAHQTLIILSHRLDDLRGHINNTDYAEKFGQEMGEKVKHDDEQYAYELQVILARIVDVL